MPKELIEDIKIYFNKHRVSIGLILIVLIVFLGSIAMVEGMSYGKQEIKIIKSEDFVEPSNQVIKESSNQGIQENDLVVFDIEGGVVNPGVYRLKVGSVIADAVEEAGGFSKDADLERISREINQASLIGNYSKIYIFTKKDREIKVAVSQPNQVYSGEFLSSNQEIKQSNNQTKDKININTATLEELDTLPKIGPVTAQRIIDWREANGGFEIIEDIKKVKGIGEEIFEEIKDLITIE